MGEQRTCGRPTKAGTPCRAQLWSAPQRACGIHKMAEDEAYEQGWRDGHDLGRAGWLDAREAAKAELRTQIEWQVRQEARQAEERKRFRLTTADGKQIVEVDGYAYVWTGEEALAMGDCVLLPANWLSVIKNGDGPFEGTVTRLGSSYDGALSAVVARR